MLYRIVNIAAPLNVNQDMLADLAAQRLSVLKSSILRVKVVKKSVDARKKRQIRFIFSLDAELREPLRGKLPQGVTEVVPYRYQQSICKKRPHQRPIVVGSGPAGMLAALILAQAGLDPLLLERGWNVERRREDVQNFWKTGILNLSSNVQFGEGGAGTFSDGKLNTGTKDPRSRKVLEEFVEAGAPEEILYEAKPHVGTDYLYHMVKNMRKRLESLGGQVLFGHRVIDIRGENGRVSSIAVRTENGESKEIPVQHAIFAIGHSARDTFEMLQRRGIAMEQKPFSVGVRIEHLQSRINKTQYGLFADSPFLGAADYKLAVHLKNGRGVYTFCMCPGGYVVGAASEKNRVVTNGMSEYARDGENANSALLVGVDGRDFGSAHPLSGMEFQRNLEEKAFCLGGGDYRAPAQTVEDFLRGKPTNCLGGVRPTYAPGVSLCNLRELFPKAIGESLAEGILQMERYLEGFSAPDSVLTGVESRSSSPVRVIRGENLQSVSLQGFYPCGEGAGYAGGIVSAAADGIRCAEAVIKEINER